MFEQVFTGYRWLPILGLPYVFSLIVTYAPVNWFTVPTVVIVAIIWVFVFLDTFLE